MDYIIHEHTYTLYIRIYKQFKTNNYYIIDGLHAVGVLEGPLAVDVGPLVELLR